MFGQTEWIVDDFDGDGVRSWADESKGRYAMHGPAGQAMGWDCSLVAENGVECEVTVTDGFLEAAGVDPVISRARWTFEDGKVVREEFLGPVDPVAFGASLEGLYGAQVEYERWVSEVHPTDYEQMFIGPCCEGRLVRMPDTIPLHALILPQYLATLD